MPPLYNTYWNASYISNAWTHNLYSKKFPFILGINWTIKTSIQIYQRIPMINFDEFESNWMENVWKKTKLTFYVSLLWHISRNSICFQQINRFLWSNMVIRSYYEVSLLLFSYFLFPLTRLNDTYQKWYTNEHFVFVSINTTNNTSYNKLINY